jgi:hypothetical protein
MREDVIPISGIKIRFADPAIQAVTLEPGHRKLEPKPVPGGVEVVAPSLELHALVVAER